MERCFFLLAVLSLVAISACGKPADSGVGEPADSGVGEPADSGVGEPAAAAVSDAPAAAGSSGAAEAGAGVQPVEGAAAEHALVMVTDASFDSQVLQADRPVLVDFWAPWCGPCLLLNPVIEQLADEYKGRVVVGKVNTDENEQLPEKYQIDAIPTLLFFHRGELVETMVGGRPKEEIAAQLDKMLGTGS